MARQYYTNGNCMVTLDGTELGLSEAPISISIVYHHLDIQVSTWGGPNGGPAEVQAMGAEAMIAMTLIHFDTGQVQKAIRQSFAGSSNGSMPAAGALMGGSSQFMALRMASPVGGIPWNFPSAYLAQQPLSWPIGNERSALQLNFRAIAYKSDPATMEAAVLYTHS